MQEGIFIGESVEKRSLQDWLFNPFRYAAGGVALGIGLAAITASALVCYAAQVHFDGVLEVHFYEPGPLWLYVAEGVSAWLCMALTLHLFGAMLAPAPFRLIDMLGTQAMARWPYLFIALVSLPDGFLRTIQYFTEEAIKTPHIESIGKSDIAVTVLGLIVFLAAGIWTVMLMYRGYAVSTGIRDSRKRILSFIVALIIASVISKVIFIVMAVRAGVLPVAVQP